MPRKKNNRKKRQAQRRAAEAPKKQRVYMIDPVHHISGGVGMAAAMALRSIQKGKP